MSRQELVEATLTKFAKRVIQQARTNLTKKKKNFDKTLYNSLTYKLNVSKNSFYLNFYMEEYGAYQDEGVKGAGGTRKTTSSFNNRNNNINNFSKYIYNSSKTSSNCISNLLIAHKYFF